MLELLKSIKNAVEATPSYHNPSFYHGNMEFLGVTFHVTLLRITYENDEIVPYNQDNEDEVILFDEMQSFIEGRYHTIQIPGREGDWVMFIYPYCM